jgi:hypothetical protein
MTAPGAGGPSPRRPSRWVDAADLLALILLGLAFAALFFGGVSVPLGPYAFRARSYTRLLIQAAVVLAVRHAFVREPSLVVRLAGARETLAARWPHLMAVLPVWFVSRGLVLLAGYLAVQVFGYTPSDDPPRISPNELQNLPVRWDAWWYYVIGVGGYEWDPARQGQQTPAFFPLNPMIMRAVWWATQDRVTVAWAGTAAAIAAFLGALVLLHRLATEKVGSEAAGWSVALLAAYPFAVFYSVPYTEGLYLLAAVGSVYWYERGAFLPAAAAGLAAGLARPNGWWLVGVLALLLVARVRTRHAFDPTGVSPGAVLALLAPVVGVAIYSAAVFGLTGDPFTWARLHAAWGRRFVWVDRTLLVEIEFLRQTGTFDWLARRPTEALNAIATVLALGAIWPVTRRFGPAYGGFVAANTIGPLLFGGLLSMGRMTAVLFPMFIWLGSSGSPATRQVLLLIFAFAQAIAAALFFTWRPLF